MTEEAEPELIERVKSQHVGKWIGLKGTHIVTVSDTHEEVLAKLKKEGIDGVYVFYSPTEEEKQYGFLFWERECELERENLSLE